MAEKMKGVDKKRKPNQTKDSEDNKQDFKSRL